MFLKPIPVRLGISDRNQSFVLHSKVNDWFLHEMRHWAEMG